MFGYIYKFIDKVKSTLSQKGQGMIEYALIIAFVAAIAAVALNKDLNTAVTNAFGKATEQLNNAADGGNDGDSGN